MRHNRYLIYEMKGKMIWAKMPARFGGGKLCGFVKNVARDIINRNIKITLTTGDEYIFREPGIIASTDEGILFLYGKVEGDESDEILFEELDKVGGDVETANGVSSTILCLGILTNVLKDIYTLIIMKSHLPQYCSH